MEGIREDRRRLERIGEDRREGRGQWYIQKARKRSFFATRIPGYRVPYINILMVNPKLSERIGGDRRESEVIGGDWRVRGREDRERWDREDREGGREEIEREAKSREGMKREIEKEAERR